MEKTFPAINEADMERIHCGLEKVFEVSAYLDFPFTLDEVTSYFLPKENITREQLRSLVAEGRFSDIPFHIHDGFLLTAPTQSESSRLQKERMSAAKLDSAAGFALALKKLVPFVKTIAVTGSVAYGSADKWDDIDLFVVTERNRLWLSAFMTLVLVRLWKLLGLRPPHLSPFCLSYVHDEEGFAKESQRNKTNPLFARELLKAKPVAGREQYRKILVENDWVGSFYSAPYAAKLKALEPALNGQTVHIRANPRRFSFFLSWSEGVAYVILSWYLRLRAYLTNLELKSEGQHLRVFDPIITAESCVYTSNFYRWLHTLWGE